MGDEHPGSRLPSNVLYFERLMYLSIVLGILAIPLSWSRLLQAARPIGGAFFIIIVDAFVLAVMVALVWLTARRAKNWARWTGLILLLLGLPGGLRVVLSNLHTQPLAGRIGLVQVALQIVALFLIFNGSSRDWFRKDSTGEVS